MALSILLQACNGGAIERRKDDARKQISDVSPTLLESFPVEELKPHSEPVTLIDVPDQGGVVSVPEPIGQSEGKTSTKLAFKKFALYVYRSSGGKNFDSLPSSWGRDDLKKMISVAKASGAHLDAATSEVEVEDIAHRIKSKAVICPSGASVRAATIETDNYFGFMGGDKRLTLFLRPKDVQGICFRIEIRPESESFTEEDLRWLLGAIEVRVADI
mgnify:CR=1 FL=1